MLSTQRSADPTVSPAAPFETWPLQRYDSELGTFAWYARPAVFVTQTTVRVATLAHARAAAAAMDHVLKRFRSEIELHNGLLVIHDWRTVEEFDAEARTFYSKRVEGYKKGDQRGAVVAINRNPIVRAILQLAAIAVPFRTGHTVQFTTDPTPLLAQQNIEPLHTNPFAELRF